MSPPTMEYAKEEVAKHNTVQDFWTIVYGKVYHLDEQFVKTLHPGGEYIMAAAGKDGTFLYEDNHHPETAMEFLQEFYIGKLKREAE